MRGLCSGKYLYEKMGFINITALLGNSVRRYRYISSKERVGQILSRPLMKYGDKMKRLFLVVAAIGFIGLSPLTSSADEIDQFINDIMGDATAVAVDNATLAKCLKKAETDRDSANKACRGLPFPELVETCLIAAAQNYKEEVAECVAQEF